MPITIRGPRGQDVVVPDQLLEARDAGAVSQFLKERGIDVGVDFGGVEAPDVGSGEAPERARVNDMWRQGAEAAVGGLGSFLESMPNPMGALLTGVGMLADSVFNRPNPQALMEAQAQLQAAQQAQDLAAVRAAAEAKANAVPSMSFADIAKSITPDFKEGLLQGVKSLARYGKTIAQASPINPKGLRRPFEAVDEAIPSYGPETLTEALSGRDASTKALDVATLLTRGLVEMAPQTMAQVALPGLGSLLNVASETGDIYGRAIDEGREGPKAYLSALVGGLVNQQLNKIGLERLARKTGARGGAVDALSGSFLTNLKRNTPDALIEPITEAIQEAVGYIAERMGGAEEAPWTGQGGFFDRLLTAAAMSALPGAQQAVVQGLAQTAAGRAKERDDRWRAAHPLAKKGEAPPVAAPAPQSPATPVLPVDAGAAAAPSDAPQPPPLDLTPVDPDAKYAPNQAEAARIAGIARGVGDAVEEASDRRKYGPPETEARRAASEVESLRREEEANAAARKLKSAGYSDDEISKMGPAGAARALGIISRGMPFESEATRGELAMLGYFDDEVRAMSPKQAASILVNRTQAPATASAYIVDGLMELGYTRAEIAKMGYRDAVDLVLSGKRAKSPGVRVDYNEEDGASMVPVDPESGAEVAMGLADVEPSSASADPAMVRDLRDLGYSDEQIRGFSWRRGFSTVRNQVKAPSLEAEESSTWNNPEAIWDQLIRGAEPLGDRHVVRAAMEAMDAGGSKADVVSAIELALDEGPDAVEGVVRGSEEAVEDEGDGTEGYTGGPVEPVFESDLNPRWASLPVREADITNEEFQSAAEQFVGAGEISEDVLVSRLGWRPSKAKLAMEGIRAAGWVMKDGRLTTQKALDAETKKAEEAAAKKAEAARVKAEREAERERKKAEAEKARAERAAANQAGKTVKIAAPTPTPTVPAASTAPAAPTPASPTVAVPAAPAAPAAPAPAPAAPASPASANAPRKRKNVTNLGKKPAAKPQDKEGGEVGERSQGSKEDQRRKEVLSAPEGRAVTTAAPASGKPKAGARGVRLDGGKKGKAVNIEPPAPAGGATETAPDVGKKLDADAASKASEAAQAGQTEEETEILKRLVGEVGEVVKQNLMQIILIGSAIAAAQFSPDAGIAIGAAGPISGFNITPEQLKNIKEDLKKLIAVTGRRVIKFKDIITKALKGELISGRPTVFGEAYKAARKETNDAEMDPDDVVDGEVNAEETRIRDAAIGVSAEKRIVPTDDAYFEWQTAALDNAPQSKRDELNKNTFAKDSAFSLGSFIANGFPVPDDMFIFVPKDGVQFRIPAPDWYQRDMNTGVWMPRPLAGKTNAVSDSSPDLVAMSEAESAALEAEASELFDWDGLDSHYKDLTEGFTPKAGLNYETAVNFYDKHKNRAKRIAGRLGKQIDEAVSNISHLIGTPYWNALRVQPGSSGGLINSLLEKYKDDIEAAYAIDGRDTSLIASDIKSGNAPIVESVLAEALAESPVPLLIPIHFNTDKASVENRSGRIQRAIDRVRDMAQQFNSLRDAKGKLEKVDFDKLAALIPVSPDELQLEGGSLVEVRFSPGGGRAFVLSMDNDFLFKSARSWKGVNVDKENRLVVDERIEGSKDEEAGERSAPREGDSAAATGSRVTVDFSALREGDFNALIEAGRKIREGISAWTEFYRNNWRVINASSPINIRVPEDADLDSFIETMRRWLKNLNTNHITKDMRESGFGRDSNVSVATAVVRSALESARVKRAQREALRIAPMLEAWGKTVGLVTPSGQSRSRLLTLATMVYLQAEDDREAAMLAKKPVYPRPTENEMQRLATLSKRALSEMPEATRKWAEVAVIEKRWREIDKETADVDAKIKALQNRLLELYPRDWPEDQARADEVASLLESTSKWAAVAHSDPSMIAGMQMEAEAAVDRIYDSLANKLSNFRFAKKTAGKIEMGATGEDIVREVLDIKRQLFGENGTGGLFSERSAKMQAAIDRIYKRGEARAEFEAYMKAATKATGLLAKLRYNLDVAEGRREVPKDRDGNVIASPLDDKEVTDLLGFKVAGRLDEDSPQARKLRKAFKKAEGDEAGNRVYAKAGRKAYEATDPDVDGDRYATLMKELGHAGYSSDSFLTRDEHRRVSWIGRPLDEQVMASFYERKALDSYWKAASSHMRTIKELGGKIREINKALKADPAPSPTAKAKLTNEKADLERRVKQARLQMAIERGDVRREKLALEGVADAEDFEGVEVDYSGGIMAEREKDAVAFADLDIPDEVTVEGEDIDVINSEEAKLDTAAVSAAIRDGDMDVLEGAVEALRSRIELLQGKANTKARNAARKALAIIRRNMNVPEGVSFYKDGIKAIQAFAGKSMLKAYRQRRLPAGLRSKIANMVGVGAVSAQFKVGAERMREPGDSTPVMNAMISVVTHNQDLIQPEANRIVTEMTLMGIYEEFHRKLTRGDSNDKTPVKDFVNDPSMRPIVHMDALGHPGGMTLEDADASEELRKIIKRRSSAGSLDKVAAGQRKVLVVTLPKLNGATFMLPVKFANEGAETTAEKAEEAEASGKGKYSNRALAVMTPRTFKQELDPENPNRIGKDKTVLPGKYARLEALKGAGFMKDARILAVLTLPPGASLAGVEYRSLGMNADEANAMMAKSAADVLQLAVDAEAGSPINIESKHHAGIRRIIDLMADPNSHDPAFVELHDAAVDALKGATEGSLAELSRIAEAATPEPAYDEDAEDLTESIADLLVTIAAEIEARNRDVEGFFRWALNQRGGSEIPYPIRRLYDALITPGSKQKTSVGASAEARSEEEFYGQFIDNVREAIRNYEADQTSGAIPRESTAEERRAAETKWKQEHPETERGARSAVRTFSKDPRVGLAESIANTLGLTVGSRVRRNIRLIGEGLPVEAGKSEITDEDIASISKAINENKGNFPDLTTRSLERAPYQKTLADNFETVVNSSGSKKPIEWVMRGGWRSAVLTPEQAAHFVMMFNGNDGNLRKIPGWWQVDFDRNGGVTIRDYSNGSKEPHSVTYHHTPTHTIPKWAVLAIHSRLNRALKGEGKDPETEAIDRYHRMTRLVNRASAKERAKNHWREWAAQLARRDIQVDPAGVVKNLKDPGYAATVENMPNLPPEPPAPSAAEVRAVRRTVALTKPDSAPEALPLGRPRLVRVQRAPMGSEESRQVIESATESTKANPNWASGLLKAETEGEKSLRAYLKKHGLKANRMANPELAGVGMTKQEVEAELSELFGGSIPSFITVDDSSMGTLAAVTDSNGVRIFSGNIMDADNLIRVLHEELIHRVQDDPSVSGEIRSLMASREFAKAREGIVNLGYDGDDIDYEAAAALALDVASRVPQGIVSRFMQKVQDALFKIPGMAGALRFVGLPMTGAAARSLLANAIERAFLDNPQSMEGEQGLPFGDRQAMASRLGRLAFRSNKDLEAALSRVGSGLRERQTAIRQRVLSQAATQQYLIPKEFADRIAEMEAVKTADVRAATSYIEALKLMTKRHAGRSLKAAAELSRLMRGDDGPLGVALEKLKQDYDAMPSGTPEELAAKMEAADTIETAAAGITAWHLYFIGQVEKATAAGRKAYNNVVKLQGEIDRAVKKGPDAADVDLEVSGLQDMLLGSAYGANTDAIHGRVRSAGFKTQVAVLLNRLATDSTNRALIDSIIRAGGPRDVVIQRLISGPIAAMMAADPSGFGNLDHVKWLTTPSADFGGVAPLVNSPDITESIELLAAVYGKHKAPVIQWPKLKGGDEDPKGFVEQLEKAVEAATNSKGMLLLTNRPLRKAMAAAMSAANQIKFIQELLADDTYRQQVTAASDQIDQRYPGLMVYGSSATGERVDRARDPDGKRLPGVSSTFQFNLPHKIYLSMPPGEDGRKETEVFSITFNAAEDRVNRARMAEAMNRISAWLREVDEGRITADPIMVNEYRRHILPDLWSAIQPDWEVGSAISGGSLLSGLALNVKVKIPILAAFSSSLDALVRLVPGQAGRELRADLDRMNRISSMTKALGESFGAVIREPLTAVIKQENISLGDSLAWNRYVYNVLNPIARSGQSAQRAIEVGDTIHGEDGGAHVVTRADLSLAIALKRWNDKVVRAVEGRDGPVSSREAVDPISVEVDERQTMHGATGRTSRFAVSPGWLTTARWPREELGLLMLDWFDDSLAPRDPSRRAEVGTRNLTEAMKRHWKKYFETDPATGTPADQRVWRQLFMGFMQDDNPDYQARQGSKFVAEFNRINEMALGGHEFQNSDEVIDKIVDLAAARIDAPLLEGVTEPPPPVDKAELRKEVLADIMTRIERSMRDTYARFYDIGEGGAVVIRSKDDQFNTARGILTAPGNLFDHLPARENLKMQAISSAETAAMKRMATALETFRRAALTEIERQRERAKTMTPKAKAAGEEALTLEDLEMLVDGIALNLEAINSRLAPDPVRHSMASRALAAAVNLPTALVLAPVANIKSVVKDAWFTSTVQAPAVLYAAGASPWSLFGSFASGFGYLTRGVMRAMATTKIGRAFGTVLPFVADMAVKHEMLRERLSQLAMSDQRFQNQILFDRYLDTISDANARTEKESGKAAARVDALSRTLQKVASSLFGSRTRVENIAVGAVLLTTDSWLRGLKRNFRKSMKRREAAGTYVNNPMLPGYKVVPSDIFGHGWRPGIDKNQALINARDLFGSTRGLEAELYEWYERTKGKKEAEALGEQLDQNAYDTVSRAVAGLTIRPLNSTLPMFRTARGLMGVMSRALTMLRGQQSAVGTRMAVSLGRNTRKTALGRNIQAGGALVAVLILLAVALIAGMWQDDMLGRLINGVEPANVGIEDVMRDPSLSGKLVGRMAAATGLLPETILATMGVGPNQYDPFDISSQMYAASVARDIAQAGATAWNRGLFAGFEQLSRRRIPLVNAMWARANGETEAQSLYRTYRRLAPDGIERDFTGSSMFTAQTAEQAEARKVANAIVAGRTGEAATRRGNLVRMLRKGGATAREAERNADVRIRGQMPIRRAISSRPTDGQISILRSRMSPAMKSLSLREQAEID